MPGMKRIHPWLPPAIALLWLGALELACYQNGAALWFAFVALSIALVVETTMLWLRGGTGAQKVAICVAGAIVVPVAILDVAVYDVAHSDRSLATNENAARALPHGGAAEDVCAACKILWHDKRTWLLGQPRTDAFACLYGIRGFEPGPVGSLVPADFSAYAHLVDPHYRDDGLAEGPFLSWQYPRQRFVLVHFDEEATRPDIATAVEDNRMGARGIYTVAPFFSGPAYEWSNRIESYRNLLQFLFGDSPNCRTDLQDDPYFEIVRGQRAKAELRLSSLPPDRREFLKRKLAAPPPSPSDDDIEH